MLLFLGLLRVPTPAREPSHDCSKQINNSISLAIIIHLIHIGGYPFWIPLTILICVTIPPQPHPMMTTRTSVFTWLAALPPQARKIISARISSTEETWMPGGFRFAIPIARTARCPAITNVRRLAARGYKTIHIIHGPWLLLKWKWTSRWYPITRI